MKDDLPQYVTLVGSGFIDWVETVCHFGSQEIDNVVFVNETHLQCMVSARAHFMQKRYNDV